MFRRLFVAKSVHEWLSAGLQLILAAGLALSIYEQQWLNVLTITGILLLTLLPTVLGHRFKFYIPPEFEMLAIMFIFAALFLGEVRNYYERFWWWDVALHATSGGLLGIFGVLLVYILNKQPRIDVHMKPAFISLFAFAFAVCIGALWEIFEFAMDSFFGLNMQKSGLVDTMWDLIVDAAGALLVSIVGYILMKTRSESFVRRAIETFVARNPRLFQRDPRTSGSQGEKS